MSGELSPAERARQASHRRPYRAPQLERLGDIRGLTLGTSPGVPDSGAGGTELNLNP